jgi:hypothetical protein
MVVITSGGVEGEKQLFLILMQLKVVISSLGIKRIPTNRKPSDTTSRTTASAFVCFSLTLGHPILFAGWKVISSDRA